MGIHREREKVVRANLAAVAQDLLPVGNRSQRWQVAWSVVGVLVRVERPFDDDEVETFIRIKPLGPGGGEAVKTLNHLLDIRKLLTAIATGVLTFAGVLQAPWLAVLAALCVWDHLLSAMRVELSEKDASVLWTLWNMESRPRRVKGMDVLNAVN